MRDNPFRYGAPVDGDYYFERKRLRDSCESLLTNDIPLMLVGPRRYGKTSFAKNFCHTWEEKKYGHAILLDVYNVSSYQDFLLQLLYSLHARKSLWQKFCVWTKNLPDRLKPSSLEIEKEDFGKFTLQWLADNSDQQKKLHIKDALESLSKFDRKLCLVIDESQQLSAESLGDGGWMEATLRQYIQQQVGTVSYMLTGSRRDLVHAMVNDQRRPLYRIFNVIDFPPLESDFTTWIVERFRKADTIVSEEAVQYLRAQVNDSPNYVQMVCFHLVAMGCTDVHKGTIDTALASIVTQNAYSYETHLHNLSPAQQRVLRMVALEEDGYFSEPLRKQYEISSAAHVSNALNALKKKNILDQETPGRGRASFDDPLFRLWIRYKFGGYVPGNNSQHKLFD